jgi:hypothetical protein
MHDVRFLLRPAQSFFYTNRQVALLRGFLPNRTDAHFVTSFAIPDPHPTADSPNKRAILRPSTPRYGNSPVYPGLSASARLHGRIGFQRRCVDSQDLAVQDALGVGHFRNLAETNCGSAQRARLRSVASQSCRFFHHARSGRRILAYWT